MKTVYNKSANKSGVYKIINTSNNRIYIGSAKTFKTRHQGHLTSLRKGTHHNKYLQNDFNKCGEDAFEFHVIEIIDGEQAERLLIEQKHIDKYYDSQDRCYNFKPKAKAKSRSCYSRTPEQTSKLISENMKRIWSEPKTRTSRNAWKQGTRLSIETKKKMSEAAKNKTWTPEQRAKITQALRGRKNGPHSEEAKLKMSQNRKSKGMVVTTNKDTGEVLEFHSQGACARHFGVSTTTIANLIASPSRTGYKDLNTWKLQRTNI